MSIATSSTIFVAASVIVTMMLIHYYYRAGRRSDYMCVAGLLAASIGLYVCGHRAPAPDEPWLLAFLQPLALVTCACVILMEGLKRLRKAG